MPIAELGYRPWEGERRGWLMRSMAISRYGIRVAHQNSKLLRRLLWLAWVPLVYFAPVFFAIGWVADPANDLAEMNLLGKIGMEILGRDLVSEIRAHPEVLLPPIWSAAFVLFFAWMQSWIAMLVVTIVGPRLISWDLRGKAFLLYFSKPISFWQYMLGKLGIIQYFVLRISLFPALALYLISILLAPNLTTLIKTSPIMLQILLASLLVSVPVSVVMLLFSSLSRDPRVAAFCWIFLWIFGEASYWTMTFRSGGHEVPSWVVFTSIRETAIQATATAFQLVERVADFLVFFNSRDIPVDIITDLAEVEGTIGHQFRLAQQMAQTGAAPSNAQGTQALLFILGVTIVATLILRRRIQKPVSI